MTFVSDTNRAEPLSAKALEVYRRLAERYGEQAFKPRDAMRTLIGTMLSQRTQDANTTRAFDALWNRYGSWEAVRAAPVDELTATISLSTFPEVKAPNIQRVLTRVIEERGEPNIDFLADLPVEQALAWLLSLPGVGIKTASLVLLFVFQKPVLPVDTHVHRVSQRVGLIGPRDTAEKAHSRLLALLSPEPNVLYTFHRDMINHGQQVCVWGEPRCSLCHLTDLCDWYQTHRAGQPAGDLTSVATTPR